MTIYVMTMTMDGKIMKPQVFTARFAAIGKFTQWLYWTDNNDNPWEWDKVIKPENSKYHWELENEKFKIHFEAMDIIVP